MPDYQFILAPKLCEIGAQYSVSKLANASAACVLVLLHVFHVFLACPACVFACLACARRHALHVLLNLLFLFLHALSVWICLSVFVCPLVSVCLSVCISLPLFYCPSVCLSVSQWFYLCACLFVSICRFFFSAISMVSICVFLSCWPFSPLPFSPAHISPVNISFLFTFLPFPHFLRCLVTGSRDAIIKLKNKYAAMGSCLILLVKNIIAFRVRAARYIKYTWACYVTLISLSLYLPPSASTWPAWIR